MEETIKNILKITAVILGSIIGAGFASGQEINIFFNEYGKNGFWGIILASTIIGIIVYIVLKYLIKNNIETYKELLLKIFKGNKLAGGIMEKTMLIFLLLSFYIMILGFAALLMQEYKIPEYLGTIIISSLAFLVFLGNTKRIINVNIILLPILIIIIIILGIKGINVNNIFIEEIATQKNWISSSLIYSSYNLAILIPLLVVLKREIIKKEEVFYISTLTFILIMILASIVYFLLNTVNIQNIEIPIIFIANKMGVILTKLSGVLIMLAIFTSVVCSGFSFLNGIIKEQKNYVLWAATICITATFFWFLKFSHTLKIVYTILGIIGIIQIFGILLAKNRKN